jgi:outer membrane protein insertion porin family
LITALQLAAAQCKPEDGNGQYLAIVRHVRFDDTQTVTTSERRAIAQELAGLCFDRNMSGEMLERIRDAFQRRGFFKAVVADRLRINVIDASAHPSPVDIAAVVNEGDRYRFGNVEFKSNKAFSSEELRPLLPLKKGDVFDIEKVRQALKAFRNLYGKQGYINFTPVPDTIFDESDHSITLVIELDEGEQFRLGRFEVVGVREIAEPIVKDWKLRTGDIFDGDKVWAFLAEHAGVLQPESLHIKQNNETNTVDIRIVICPADYYCFDR